MDSRRAEDNRPTVDYTQYDDTYENEYNRRFSLHSVGAGNPMMGESMDYNYAEANQEDAGVYYNRPSDMLQSNIHNYQMANSYAQEYHSKDERFNYQSLVNQQQDDLNNGKTLQDRMDALDDTQNFDTADEANDGDEANVDADEREGNRDYANDKQPSYEQEEQEEQDEPDEQEDQDDTNNEYNQNLHIEERMTRLKLSNERSNEDNYNTYRTADPQMMENQYSMRDMNQDQYENGMSGGGYTPHNDTYSEGYQNYDDYNGGQQDSYQNDGQDGSQSNMLIMQYESVLQNVNREFQKLLNKNKDTEEELSLTKMKLEQVAAAYEQEANRNNENEVHAQGRMNAEKRLQLLFEEKSKIDQENILIRDQLAKKTAEIDYLNSRVMELEHETSQIGILESTKSASDQTLFSFQKENESLKSDMRNMERIENTLKNEIEDLLDKRKLLEEINQNLKNQICECNIVIRQVATQLDSVKRENIALTSNIQIFRRSEEQLRYENSNLKEIINSNEAERIHYRAISEQLQRELAYMKKESASNYPKGENGMLHYNGKYAEPFYQPPHYDDNAGPPGEYNMSNYDYILPKTELHSPMLQGGRDPNEKAKFEDLYQPPLTSNGSQGSLNKGLQGHPGYERQSMTQPNTPSTRERPPHIHEEMKMVQPGHRKSNSKLPMHLASSVSFDYPDKGDQFYRKNQQTAPNDQNNPQYQSSVNPNIKEDAQKAYFSSHLENVFRWDQANASKQNPNGPPYLPAQQQQQYPQGSQYNNPEPTLAKELTQNIPPASQMNTQQKHTQIMKLENSLLTFQMEKDRLKSELEKIPESHRQNHNKKQRKEDLEAEINLLDKNINTVKLKLRDIKS